MTNYVEARTRKKSEITQDTKIRDDKHTITDLTESKWNKGTAWSGAANKSFIFSVQSLPQILFKEEVRPAVTSLPLI